MKNQKILLRINYKDIENNFKEYKRISKQGELCIPVLKGNANGMGQLQTVAQLLNMEKPQKDYYVYLLEEGIQLRKNFGDKVKNIFCITGPMKGQEKFYYNNKITPVLNSIEQMETWSNYAKSKNEVLDVVLDFNLALNRSGFQSTDIDYVQKFVSDKANKLNIVTVMGHMACQYTFGTEKGKKFTEPEYNKFLEIASKFPNINRGIFASVMLLRHPEKSLETSRPGVSLYCGFPSTEIEKSDSAECELKTALTLMAPLFKKSDKEVYIKFGIKHGMATAYKDNGYVLVDGEKIYAKSVEMDKTIFKVDDANRFAGKMALLTGYNGNDVLDAYVFSLMNATVPEEILSKIPEHYKFSPEEYELDLISNVEKVKEKDWEERDLEPRTIALIDKNTGKIKKFISTILEIREIEEDGYYGYGAADPVKKGEIIATFPVGYTDGIDRKMGKYDVNMFVEVDGKLVECKFCKRVSMDQNSVRIPIEYKDKVKVGDKLIIIDNEKGAFTSRFEKAMDIPEEEIFFMVPHTIRVKKIYE
ncbi:MAG TPA: alanine racemase [Rickettsiales bacterium]|nr:alanine racemase [Rickettsiales bacterium]